jgi:hypothetical protein
MLEPICGIYLNFTNSYDFIDAQIIIWEAVNSVVGSVQEELHLCREEDTEQQKM